MTSVLPHEAGKLLTDQLRAAAEGSQSGLTLGLIISLLALNASAADLNGYGKPDLIAANRPGPSYVCLNDGKARFDTQPCLPIRRRG